MSLLRKWYYWSVSALADEEISASIIEDLEYRYQQDVSKKGRIYARFQQYCNFLPIILPLISDLCKGAVMMLGNYSKIAMRNLRKHKAYTAINIMGLAIGMLCTMLILLWVQDELSYDKYNEKADRIIRVTRRWLNSDGAVSLHLGHVAPPIAPLLKTDFPEIEHIVRLTNISGVLVGNPGEQYIEDRLFCAEEDLFKIFTFDLQKGNVSTCLQAPGTIVLTESMAEKYFSDQDPMGQMLHMDFGEGVLDLKITGIMADMPEQSHIHSDFFISFKTYEMFVGDDELQNWGSNNYGTYLLLEKGRTREQLQAQMDAFIERHYGEGQSESTQLILQQLTDIHLYSNLDSEYEANGDIANVWIFSAIAVFILLIACINFMNLATARSAGRAREVGLRKVVGARRIQIVRQFLNEAVLMAALSGVIAIASTWLLLPKFNEFLGKQIHFNLIENPLLGFGMIGIVVFVGIVSGSYPAFFLSSFKPIKVLRGTSRKRSSGFSFRTVLVVLQFSISIILIISVTAVSKQLSFMQNIKLGIDKENVVLLASSPYINEHLADIKQQLLAHQNVISVSAAKRIPSGRLLDSSGAKVIRDGEETYMNFRIANLRVDHDYISTFRMNMAAGRDFMHDMPTDSDEAFILNEAAVLRIGWDSSEEAIGQAFIYGGRRGRIIGVVEDVNFESLHKSITPIVMYISSGSLNRISIRITPDDISETLEFLKNQWARYNPGRSFEYQFLDQRFDQLYRSERKLHELFNIFALLSILISCLGLFGLA
ncbi:ABC transporter permease, partial [bacterium]|nr:ABC transporter permease [bacterium]